VHNRCEYLKANWDLTSSRSATRRSLAARSLHNFSIDERRLWELAPHLVITYGRFMNRTDKKGVRRPLFRALHSEPRRIHLEFDGEPIAAREQETVASLLLGLVDPHHYRQSRVSAEPRAPLCMMGVCFECLVEIDGQTNQQGCLVRVRDGMRIRRQIPERCRS
jgi:hypothetical protein